MPVTAGNPLEAVLDPSEESHFYLGRQLFVVFIEADRVAVGPDQTSDITR